MLLPTDVIISTYTDGTVSARGVPTRTFTDQPVVKGRLAPTAGREVTQGEQEAIADWLVILPPGTQVQPRDRVKALGLVLEVVAPPYHAVGRFVEHHVELQCRSVQ